MARADQATVREWSPDTGAGSVLFDDGRVADFPPDAFLASGLQRLRPGQRVRVEYAESGDIVLVTIFTL